MAAAAAVAATLAPPHRYFTFFFLRFLEFLYFSLLSSTSSPQPENIYVERCLSLEGYRCSATWSPAEHEKIFMDFQNNHQILTFLSSFVIIVRGPPSFLYVIYGFDVACDANEFHGYTKSPFPYIAEMLTAL